MSREYSPEVKELFEAAKNRAERLGNNYISSLHVLLCLNEFRTKSKLDLKISFSEQKEILKALKGHRLNDEIDNLYPLTKDLAFGFASCGIHCRILGDQVITPDHIYLSTLAFHEENKKSYLELVIKSHIQLSWYKKVLLNLSFHPFFKKSFPMNLLLKICG